jgi:hypothetical protein
MNKDVQPGTRQADELSVAATSPYLPFHIAALAWIFLPGGKPFKDDGSTISATADITGLINQINLVTSDGANAQAVSAALDMVLTSFDNNLQNPNINKEFVSVRGQVIALLAKMKNLWGGIDSEFSVELMAKIASIGRTK